MPLIDPGKKAPVFSLADAQGATHHLKEYLGRPVILFFYPKDGTPGCTAEACGFRDLLPALEPLTAVVLGVSADSAESHATFAAAHSLNFPLLVDAFGRDGVPKTCDKYGVWQEKTFYGRTSMGVVRTTYLVDEAGKVAQRWDNVRVEGHAAEVLDAVRGLRRGLPLMIGAK
ncbi:MAG TPA: peroxiredoxin [Phycisphaerales bacterium]|nr:peroxiredoxin [Phycisphaerales bacterium]HMP35964.1 peroxiredoxin [Phycisphaerales bacterium]